MNSLSGRVCRSICILAALVVMPICVLGYRVSSSKLERIEDDGLRQKVGQLSQLLPLVRVNVRDPSVAPDLAMVAGGAGKHADPFGFQYWDDGNRLVLASPNFARLPLDATAPGFSDVTFEGHRWRVLTQLGSDRHWLRMAERFDARNAVKRALAAELLGIGLIGISMLVLVGAASIRRSLHPLSTLTERIGERRPGHTEPVGSQGLPAEFHPLVAALNSLLSRFGRNMASGIANPRHQMQ